MRAKMDRYGDAVRALARKYPVLLVDTQAAFDEVLKNLNPGALAEDRVHPNLTGHVVLARAFLQGINYSW